MNKARALLFVFAFLVLLLAGCVQSGQTQEAGNEDNLNGGEAPENNSLPTQKVSSDENTDLSGVEISLSVSTDKQEYSSNEEAVITVVANSSDSVNDVIVKVWGITPYSKNYIENEKTIDLEEGENIIEFVETTPYCTAGCGGVYPGPYDLHASIEYNGKELAKAETEIMLTSH